MDRIDQEFERWHGPTHLEGEGSDVDITPACRSSYRAGFERAVELAATTVESMTLGNSPGPLMDGGFNFAKDCAAEHIRALAMQERKGGGKPL